MKSFKIPFTNKTVSVSTDHTIKKASLIPVKMVFNNRLISFFYQNKYLKLKGRGAVLLKADIWGAGETGGGNIFRKGEKVFIEEGVIIGKTGEKYYIPIFEIRNVIKNDLD